MTELAGLSGLRGLQQDLIALEESRLRNVERLWADLEARIEEFRKLLDKPSKNESSRKKVLSGEIRIHEEDYTINDEFKDSALQLADGLDLDEVESAKLLLGAQQDADVLQRSATASAVIRYQEQRQLLLECLRLVLKQSSDPDGDEEHRDILRKLVSLILETKDGPARNSSLYARKCLVEMGAIETWLQALGDRYQGSLTIGQPMNPDHVELIQFQQASLGHQHESLGAILTHLVKANYTSIDDFYKLLEHLPRLVKWNSLALHHIPIIIAMASQHGSPEGSSNFREAKMIHQRIIHGKDSIIWPLRNLQAATMTWWLAEYSGWFVEPSMGSPMQGMDLEAEAEIRSKAFFEALKDGAFQCILSVCSQIRPSDWYDPVRNGLTRLLLKDAPALPREVMFATSCFQELVMEQVETFVDAFVSNMPDTLRRFKAEEDDQRKRILSTLQADTRNSIAEQDLHLERFLVIISYAFDGRVDAAESFWADTDSNLYGFLQWASKRQSTPRAGAFCELLRAISKGEECATAAHRFLLEEGSNTSTSRIRKTSSLSWNLIFEEINLYTLAVRDSSGGPRTVSSFSGKIISGEVDEPESGLMLESYLRLTAHLCRESADTRMWILRHPSFRILDALFLLSSNTIPSRIQACAFGIVRALLTEKTVDLSVIVWNTLDQWVSGCLTSPTGTAKPAKLSLSPAQSEAAIFELIAADFEVSCEFINLLHSLVTPSVDDSGLNDSLPFPEQLGSAYRTPGIEPYIDFAFGRIFALSTQQLDDPLQLRILRSSVLDFAATCLTTFNEDLVILANRSTVAVDNAMNTSSLAAYIQLHPFTRVMEWMFNDKVLNALFAAARQDTNEVSNSSRDSPLLVSLIRSIDVMNLMMDLQSTYLEIARPQVKLHAVGRRKAVLNPSLASFEDSVATHLSLVVDLGLYAGTGNQALAVSSLKLLEKLSSSRRLNHQSNTGIGQRINGNRLVEVLEQQDRVDQIAGSLVSAMHFDFRELSEGSEAPGWLIKSVILDFLYACLTSSSGRPTLAHALLGFSCGGSSVEISPGGLFVTGTSLFHTILNLLVDYPDNDGDTMLPWALSLKQKGMRVLVELWSSPLTAIFTLTELRASDFLFAFFMKQQPISPITAWGGRLSKHPEFLYTDSSVACGDYLEQRRALLDYTSAEIRLLAEQDAPSLNARIVSTLLGFTSMPNGTQEPNQSVFDLFDFVELEFVDEVQSPELGYFAGVDFSVSADNGFGSDGVQYDLKIIEELMALRLNELRLNGRLQESNEEQRVLSEARDILMIFQGKNQCNVLRSAKARLLKAWSNVVKLLVSHCDLDQSNKSSLILRSLQMVNPKLERYSEDNASGALELARLVQDLLTQLDFDTLAIDQAKAEDVGNDKLFQTFRTAIRAAHMPHGSSHFHEVLYNICYRYLAGTTRSSDAPVRRRYETHTIKAAGEVLVEALCDDAYGGSGTCRISALLLLNSLVALAKADNSAYIIDSLVRSNSIVLLVETISDIPQELRTTDRKDIPMLLSYYEAKLSLLLTLSQTRVGATHIAHAGLFQAVRTSGLFSVDPDLGIEIDNTEALDKYYNLLLSVTRVITSVVLSRGPQNEQTIDHARSFLVENRPLVVAMFKRQAKVGAVTFESMGVGVEELVELFVLLITITGFLDYEEKRDTHKARRVGFS